MVKCRFKEWLYGPKNKWSEEPPKAKQKKKEMLIYKAPPVKCDYGVKSNYGLVPLELGIGHYCGHMVDYDEVGYCCGKHEIIFFLLLRLMIFFCFNRALGNASGNLMIIKLGSWMS